ncbi:three component ABC system middle component [Paenibacillus sp. FSL M7-0896]|uniref:three component ABC system middle component n=1 Tax=Paenibacillus sp. FSL M7-0896 TaxID=2921610 RepID=UPI0030D879AD
MEDNKIKVKYVDPIQNITTNPFFASRLLHSFFTGYDKENASLNLIYLVLPLVFYRSSRNLLVTAKSTSSLRSLFVDDSVKATSLGGLQERILYFEKISNQALIIAVNDEKMKLDVEGITLKKTFDYKSILNQNVKDYCRAAYYLGLLCSRTELANIYRLLGVTLV